jgi:hypothetical protein
MYSLFHLLLSIVLLVGLAGLAFSLYKAFTS